MHTFTTQLALTALTLLIWVYAYYADVDINRLGVPITVHVITLALTVAAFVNYFTIKPPFQLMVFVMQIVSVALWLSINPIPSSAVASIALAAVGQISLVILALFLFVQLRKSMYSSDMEAMHIRESAPPNL